MVIALDQPTHAKEVHTTKLALATTTTIVNLVVHNPDASGAITQVIALL